MLNTITQQTDTGLGPVLSGLQLQSNRGNGRFDREGRPGLRRRSFDFRFIILMYRFAIVFMSRISQGSPYPDETHISTDRPVFLTQLYSNSRQ